MSNTPHVLLERPGRIHETLGFDEFWVQGSYEEGMRVDDDSVIVEHLLVEFCFVLPTFSKADPGRFPVFTGGTGWPGETPDEPFFRVPGRKRSTPSGTLLHMTYEPSASSFHFSMNAGTTRAELQTVTLVGASSKEYTGRVLRASVLITRAGMYASIVEPFTARVKLFGELSLRHRSRVHVWGRTPTGHWWLMSGAESDQDDEESSFPAGFGLSDLRLTLIDSEERLAMVRYSGELEHLIHDHWDDAHPFGSDTVDLDFLNEQPMSQMLFDLAEQLHLMPGGDGSWARRVERLAEETQVLFRLDPWDPEISVAAGL